MVMRSTIIASIAVATLVMPALAQQQQKQPPAQSGGQQSQQQTQGQNQPGNGSQQARNEQISPRQLNESQVKQLQQALDGKGYHAGRADGKWGPESERALKDFQKAQNVQSTDEIDANIVTALGMHPEEFGLQADSVTTTGQAPRGTSKSQSGGSQSSPQHNAGESQHDAGSPK
jgi:peptidoglycan hydrolase-like protein with peptidoglycan-binding domain